MNIIELLSEHHIDHRTEGHEHCRPGWVQIECPFCSPHSGRFRMGINIQYVYANCWHCGHKSLAYILTKMLDMPAKQVKEVVSSVRPERVEKPEHAGNYLEPPNIHKMILAHRKYLRRRRFDPHRIEQLWNVRGIGLAEYLQWRLFIPIYHHGLTVSWTTRSIGDRPRAKYISATPREESIPHKHLLYGEDYCRHAIVVVEGPLDAWAGGPGFCALFGLSYTNQQAQKISKYPIRAICFDSNPEAQDVAQKLASDLSVFPGETYNIVLDSEDPGDATRNEIQKIRREILK